MGATLDAPTLRRAMALYARALEAHREEIDSLNVFPVPDGDTGTNMLMTQRAVAEALPEDGSLTETADAIARAALEGARGSSGLILAQILRALCAELASRERPDAAALAEGLARADAEARSAVSEPAEGTLLTVLRDASRAARRGGADPAASARAALRAAEVSLARTPDLLPALREAGVVDAGGRGLVLLLDALHAAITGEELASRAEPLGPVRRGGDAPGFEVTYLLETPPERVGPLREALAGIGEAVVVAGGGGAHAVHVHTGDPDAAVEAGRAVGRPRRVRAAPLHGAAEVPIVAVAEGEGFEEIFRALGVAVVVGGRDDPPSADALLEAIERTPGEVVYVLANGAEVGRALRAPGRRVEIVPTLSAPQGVAAALAYSPRLGARAMASAAATTASARLARAGRAATTPAGPVSPGDWVGIDDADDEVWAVGPDPTTASARLVAEHLVRADPEAATVFWGLEGSAEEARGVAEAIAAACPGLQTEVRMGGQRGSPYLLAVG